MSADHPFDYPAKVLLFGEYTVLLGSEALSIPIRNYGSRWISSESQESFSVFRSIINKIVYQDYSVPLNKEQWQSDESEKIMLASSIPFGSGLGSSGNLCAAIYHRYFQIKREAKEGILNDLKQMESSFHGQSSGLDPMTIFLNQTIHYKSQIRVLEHLEGSIKWPFFLWNSKEERNTKTLMIQYRKLLEHDSFYSLQSEFVEICNQCIKWFIKGEYDIFMKYLKKLSILQLERLSSFIPENVRKIWRNGLEQDRFYMKLCGAGGGGYFIGCAKSKKMIPEGGISILN